MKKIPILLSVLLTFSFALPNWVNAATTDAIHTNELSFVGEEFDFEAFYFEEWEIDETVSLVDSYNAVHTLTPEPFTRDGNSALFLNLDYEPSSSYYSESLLYLEFYLEDGGMAISQGVLFEESTWPTSLSVELGAEYFDQEFIYVRMGMLEDDWDTELSGVQLKKLRNPYFQESEAPGEEGPEAPSKSDLVIISNESLYKNTMQSTGSFSLEKLNQSATQSDELPKDAYKVDFLPEFDPAKVKAPLFSLSEDSATKSMSVGATKYFWVVDVRTTTPYRIPAKLKYSGTDSEIWVHADEITSAQAQTMGEEFDSSIYPLITKNFARESDVDGNGKVAILVYDIIDGYSESGGYVAGYFSPGDLYQTSYSNGGEVFYVDTYPSMGYSKSSYDVSQAFSTIAHEFQHMTNYNQNVLIEGGVAMDTSMNEALSMAAEHMYEGAPLTGRIYYYEMSSSIANGHSLLYWDNYGDTLSNYSLSYLFGQYLRIQAGQGNAIYKEFIERPESTYTALEKIIKKYVDRNKTVGEFMTDFRQALYANDPTGLYGFNGEPALSEIVSPLYTGSLPRNLRGGGAIAVPTADISTFTPPANKGPEVTYRLIDSDGGANSPGVGSTSRIAGDDRYATAVKISQAGWETAHTVVLATGSDFPDALAGGPLAYQEDAPILLTRAATLHTETEKEIRRLGAKNVIILGSSGAVSDNVAAKLKAMGLHVDRIGGKTRYETAGLIAQRLPSNQAVVAYGLNFPDVLSVSPYAAKNGIPILLTRTDKVPAETAAALSGKQKTIVVGSSGVIHDAVLRQFPQPVRYGGKNRYETGKLINEDLPLGTEKAFVATGKNFPDALAGSVLAAKQNAPILLVSGNSIPAATQDLIQRFDGFTIVGSEGVVGADVKKALDQAAGGN